MPDGPEVSSSLLFAKFPQKRKRDICPTEYDFIPDHFSDIFDFFTMDRIALAAPTLASLFQYIFRRKDDFSILVSRLHPKFKAHWNCNDLLKSQFGPELVVWFQNRPVSEDQFEKLFSYRRLVIQEREALYLYFSTAELLLPRKPIRLEGMIR